ncbi:MAG: NAD-dependent epimerase/dehydratase family protein [Leptospirillia bacterium]
MKCLVTGGAGFIGSHLVDRLVLEGHEVQVVDDLSHGKRAAVNPSAKLVKMDIRSPRIGRKVRNFRPQVIFHLAAQMDVRKSVDDPLFDAHVNVIGTLNIMQAAVESGCPRLLFASSGGAVYGEQETFPATESHPTRPMSPYGITKRCGELYADYYKALGLHCASMRLGNVYGPRQDPHGEAGVVAIFTQLMLEGKTPTINGTGRQTRDFVYVDDVVDAFLSAFINERSGEYNVGTGIESDVNRLYELIAKHVGFSDNPIHGPAKDGEQLRSVISAKKFNGETDWEPRTSLDEGIRETVAWFRERR